MKLSEKAESNTVENLKNILATKVSLTEFK